MTPEMRTYLDDAKARWAKLPRRPKANNKPPAAKKEFIATHPEYDTPRVLIEKRCAWCEEMINKESEYCSKDCAILDYKMFINS